MSTPRRLTLATATALTAALLVPAAPAQAAYPSPNTVYRDTVEGDDFSATVRIKIGPDKKRIVKFRTVVHCPGKAKPLKITFKNIKIGPTGAFAQMKKNRTGFTYEARGQWGLSLIHI